MEKLVENCTCPLEPSKDVPEKEKRNTGKRWRIPFVFSGERHFEFFTSENFSVLSSSSFSHSESEGYYSDRACVRIEFNFPKASVTGQFCSLTDDNCIIIPVARGMIGSLSHGSSLVDVDCQGYVGQLGGIGSAVTWNQVARRFPWRDPRIAFSMVVVLATLKRANSRWPVNGKWREHSEPYTTWVWSYSW